MAKFRKKPVVVEAVRLPDAFGMPSSSYPAPQWFVDAVNGEQIIVERRENGVITYSVKTLEGVMQAEMGDWIIRGTRGELYPCKPGPFEDTFELVEDDAPKPREHVLDRMFRNYGKSMEEEEPKPRSVCPECFEAVKACPDWVQALNGVKLPPNAVWCESCNCGFFEADLLVATRRINGVITMKPEGS